MNIYWMFALADLVPVVLIIATTPLRGLSRVLAPDTQVAVMLFAIFAIRPLFTNRFEASKSIYSGFYGFVPTRDEQIAASIVGVLLLWSIAVGAVWFSQWRKWSPLRNLTEETERRPPDGSTHLPYARAVFIALGGLSLYLLALIYYRGLGTVLAMPRGRNAEVAPQGVPEILDVFPLAGSLAAATLILMAQSRPIPVRARIAVFLCTSFSVVAVSQLGNRRFMIPAVMIVLTALLMRKMAPLRLWHAFAGVVLLAVFAVVPFVRSEGNRPGENLAEAIVRYLGDFGFIAVFRNIFTTYDTEMYDYIAVVSSRLESGRADFGWGRGIFVEFLTHPLPFSMMGYTERSNEVRSYLFSFNCGSDCRLPLPVPSVGGVLYFDAWYFGVVIGGLIVGMAVRALALRWHRASVSTVMQNVVTAVCVSFSAIAARTETITALWLCIYTLMVAYPVLVVIGARTSPRNSSRAEDGLERANPVMRRAESTCTSR